MSMPIDKTYELLSYHDDQLNETRYKFISKVSCCGLPISEHNVIDTSSPLYFLNCIFDCMKSNKLIITSN
jgi:hypothetical protein